MSGAGIYIKTPSGLVAAATVPGVQGSQGPQSSLTAGPVTTGAAGTNAAATITGAGPIQTLNLTIPRGDPGSPTEFELRGTGSPEGVVTAAVGTYYTDTAITNGAMRWAKKTGTGNTGWAVIEGDTGWRAITSWTSGGVVTGQALTPSWAPVSGGQGSIRARRIGVDVLVSVSNLERLSTTDLYLWSGGYVLPTGFRPSSYLMGVSYHSAGTSGLQFGVDGSLSRCTGAQAGINGIIAGIAVLIVRGPALADVPWPTTLPGTAA